MPVPVAKAKTKQEKPTGPKTIENRKARYDYEIVDSIEAGIALAGSEVKSLFHGKANLTDAYCRVQKDEMWLMQLDIEPYDKSSHFTPERRRDRKLLMHRKQIDTFERRSLEKGLAIIPLRIYFKNGKAKVEIGLGRGKREYDKRHSIKKDETRREVERTLRSRRDDS
jgi:SsrA-binding protein